MTAQMTVYLGGPEVFLPDADDILGQKIALAAEFGFVAKFPANRLNLPPLDPHLLSRLLYFADAETALGCDVGLFNLTPFRGPSADVGTVLEMGLMLGAGRTIFGYTNIAGDYVERIAPRQMTAIAGKPVCVDADGWHVEMYGNADNAMIDGALQGSAIDIVRYDAPLPARLTDLTGYRQCLAAARAWLDGMGGSPPG